MNILPSYKSRSVVATTATTATTTTTTDWTTATTTTTATTLLNNWEFECISTRDKSQTCCAARDHYGLNHVVDLGNVGIALNCMIPLNHQRENDPKEKTLA